MVDVSPIEISGFPAVNAGRWRETFQLDGIGWEATQSAGLSVWRWTFTRLGESVPAFVAENGSGLAVEQTASATLIVIDAPYPNLEGVFKVDLREHRADGGVITWASGFTSGEGN